MRFVICWRLGSSVCSLPNVTASVLIWGLFSCRRDLNRNRLSEIDSLVFSGLSGLQVLKLKRNGIKRLMDGAFYHLLNMTRL